MINTFKPYLTLIKHNSYAKHDWFAIAFYIHNFIQFTITIRGYGLVMGIKIYDVMKNLEE